MKYSIKSLIIAPFIFIKEWRSLPLYELISYFFMFASIPMLIYGIKEYNNNILLLIFLTIVTLYTGFFAVLIWNDITDADIDAVVHPDRPIPSGRITIKKFFTIAVIFSLITLICAFLISLWCFLLVSLSALFVTFHNKFLKKRVTIAAYSEIFTPIQWLIVPVFGFVAIWTFPITGNIFSNFPNYSYLAIDSSQVIVLILFIIFTYFADNSHDLPEGIHDFEGDKKTGVKTYATSFGIKNTAIISFIMLLISGITAFFLFFITNLTFIFLIPFILVWIYMLILSFKLVKTPDKDIKKQSRIAGRKLFDYFLISFNLIFIDIFVQLIVYHFV